MEQTFMTIHNLGPDANILFASESIADILGYQPAEVHGKSCFDYFHPEEVPFARSVHSRGVLLDKAAVLHYARILSRDGRWVGCECCFTIVHDVLVACTSIYRRNAKSERRAIEAPQIRRIFSCSPRDPRYHMLEHLSPKFKMPPMEREPRAALILNRFTRNLTVMFATTSIATVLGLRPHEIKNKGFYRCIQESCLSDAIECLESAKANDSIAYLRFFFQDPREDDEIADSIANDDNIDINPEDEEMADATATATDTDMEEASTINIKLEEEDDAHVALPAVPLSSQAAPSRTPARLPSIELEAVVSCTSDGLVVILRKARPPIPPAHPPLVAFDYGDGLFAAPWGQQPIRPHFPHESLYTFRPPLLPQYMPLRENVKDAGGPPLDVLMGSIRDVAVFAWGVVGINPAMAVYGRGLPSGEARPARTGYQQSRHGATEETASSTTGKGKATEMSAAANRPHPYTTRRAPTNATYNALDPVLNNTTNNSCGFQSTWSGSTNAGWGVSNLPESAVPQMSRAELARNHQQLAQNYDPSLSSSSSRPNPPFRLPSFSRDAECQPPAYGSPVAQTPPPKTSGSSQDHHYGWH
ncbi:hypothetical protein Sste5346_007152 [Sporothrix stenoceras]|uniref:PAS domain-containing protein n=1 Tax=Sporothrix stenoceras TaxID=5173 RepID=A0ABR3YWD2_9PEZI